MKLNVYRFRRRWISRNPKKKGSGLSQIEEKGVSVPTLLKQWKRLTLQTLWISQCITSRQKMVKSADQKNEQKEKQSSEEKTQARVWDCGSSLYDSYELNSFKQLLDSAISSRSLSMPHLTDHRRHNLPPPPSKKQIPELARSLQKRLRFFMGSKQNSGWRFHHPTAQERVRLSGALSTISEVPQVDYATISPDISPFVKKTASERFTATSVVGVSA